MHENPIVIVDDDQDDLEMLRYVLKNTGIQHQIRSFDNPLPALDYLRNNAEIPFIIISDLNMPKMNGLQFKDAINEDKRLRKRRIPFIILSTSKDERFLEPAFDLAVQGYFRKSTDVVALKQLLTTIIEYWKSSSYHLNLKD